MIKVLHVGEYAQGGVATYIQTLLNHSDRTDIVDYIICSKKNSSHEWKIPKSRIIYYNYTRSVANIPKAIWAVYSAIRKINPDVIYCHSTWAGLFARLPMFITSKSAYVIYNAHGWAFLQDISEWKRKVYALIEHVLFFQTDAVVNVSKYEYNAALRYGIPEKKQVVIYSGISPVIQKLNLHVQLSKKKINMLFVGRFDPQKGLDLLLKAVSAYNHDDLHLTVIGDNIVGGGTFIEKKDSDRVTFLGWIPHDKLGSYYNACDVVVMPSRWEAFGLTAVEAMKYGKPVIVSNKGALPELIHNDVNGYIVDFQNEMSLNKINLTKEKLSTMGQQAKKDFHKLFESERMLKETFLLYTSRVDRVND
nr:glycosyltransferase [uncultured Mitsuokella sp.]